MRSGPHGSEVPRHRAGDGGEARPRSAGVSTDGRSETLTARSFGPADVRLKLILAYDGTGFHGFAAQPGQRTVAGALAEAIEALVRRRVTIVCAGRTDAGVHAWGQVIHVDVPATIDPCSLLRSCNKMLSPEVVVRSAVVAPSGFDARGSAASRLYKYLISDDLVPSPFAARRAWHVGSPLDLRAMEQATYPLLGEHDFASFCRRPKRAGDAPEASLVRRVLGARWSRVSPGEGFSAGVGSSVVSPGALGEATMLCFEIEASSFCHQMVRSVVATLVEVGTHKRKAQAVVPVLAGRDRSLAASPAPPHGLYLWRVSYGPLD
ncbi:MAG: tRNA pseudouridine(38-40) synthase TruA [Acidimicrobiales bacterium]